MDTLSEQLAGAVDYGNTSADRVFDVRRSPRNALQTAPTDPIIRESLMASPAIGAEGFRDVAAAFSL